MWLEFISSTCIPSLLKASISLQLPLFLFFCLRAVVAVALSAVLYHHALINAVIISIILGS
jgi:hypothetical protein